MTIKRVPFSNGNTKEEIVDFVLKRAAKVVDCIGYKVVYDNKGRSIMRFPPTNSHLNMRFPPTNSHRKFYFDGYYHQTEEAPHVQEAARAIFFILTGEME